MPPFRHVDGIIFVTPQTRRPVVRFVGAMVRPDARRLVLMTIVAGVCALHPLVIDDAFERLADRDPVSPGRSRRRSSR